MYNFDEVIERRGTSCLKYDALEEAFGIINRDEWIVHHLEAAGLRNKPKRMVNRRLYDDLVAGGEEAPLGEAYSLDYARDVAHLLRLYAPAVKLLNPGGEHGKVVAFHSVTENRVVQAAAQGIDYEIRGLEIHIRNPEWYKVGASVSFFKSIIFEAGGPAPFNHFIKIIHTNKLLIRCKISHIFSYIRAQV